MASAASTIIGALSLQAREFVKGAIFSANGCAAFLA